MQHVVDALSVDQELTNSYHTINLSVVDLPQNRTHWPKCPTCKNTWQQLIVREVAMEIRFLDTNKTLLREKR